VHAGAPPNPRSTYNTPVNPATLRILDANLNRAREGARVLEEHARLVLDDDALTARTKHLRHALAAAARRLPHTLAERDIEHDPGTRLTADAERLRGDTAAVATAAAKRVAEALRCLEEYSKLIDTTTTSNAHPTPNDPLSATFKQLRYELYAIEQDVAIGGPRRQRLRNARLHVLLTETLCARPWEETCRAALAGGADVIQLREKHLSDAALLARARQVRKWTQAHAALLIVNDRPDIARLADADGVHLGQADLPVAAARAIVGPQRIVGKSTHSTAEAQAALAEAPDYLAVGPMFASQTKPDVAVAGPALLHAVLPMTTLPIVAIGGLDAARIAQIGAGAWQAALCEAIVKAPDTTAAARQARAALETR